MIRVLTMPTVVVRLVVGMPVCPHRVGEIAKLLLGATVSIGEACHPRLV